MSYIALGEVRVWLDADTIASVAAAATNAPASNLKSSNLGKHWQDTGVSSLQGVTWNYAGASVSAWGVSLVGMNQNADNSSTFDHSVSTSATWDGLNLVASAEIYALHPFDRYGILSTPDLGRQDGLVVFGVDTLDSGQAVTGFPEVVSHKSGRAVWRGSNMTDGYHRARYLAVFLNPLIFPYPDRIDPRVVPLRRGHGYEVTLEWDHLQAGSLALGSRTIRGSRELDNFVAGNSNRPIAAIFDLRGVNAAGVANHAEAQPWARLGVARIVDAAAGSTAGPVGSSISTFRRTVTFRTWEEQGHDRS